MTWKSLWIARFLGGRILADKVRLLISGHHHSLDHTESLRRDHDIKFLGVLALSSLTTLKWLSVEGKVLLAKHVLERTDVRLG